MIFRKPYAFLIKYFKVINFLLALFAGFLAFRTYQVIAFFGSYIKNNYTGNFFPGFSDAYISGIVYLTLCLIIVGILGIYLLFLYKKKPNKFYLSSLIYYLIFFVLTVYMKNAMIGMETAVITAEEARVFRDTSLISLIPQIVFLILFIVRGLGLGIGKLNLKQELKELEISEQDNEEVEITFKSDAVKLRRGARRFFREFIYYIRENKFIIVIINIGLIIGMVYVVYRALPDMVDRNFKQGDYYNVGNDLIFSVNDSLITNLDYSGREMVQNKYYVVVKLLIENKGLEKLKLDYNKFRLEVNGKYLYPILDKGINFIDYASNYYNRDIKPETKNNYSLVYEIGSNEILKSYRLKIENGNTYSKKVQVNKFDYITITPVVMNKILNEGTYNLGDTISLQNSNLNNSTILFNNPIITDKYTYDYEHCVKENCNTYKDIVSINYLKNNKLLLILDYQYQLDETVPFAMYSKSIDKFLDSFLKVRYVIDGEEKISSTKNVTPSKLKNKIVLETTNEIDKANSIYLVITIRNKEYSIKIK